MSGKTDPVGARKQDPLYESMIWKEETCVDFQESRDHPIPPELTNELEVPPPTDEEYALQEEQDLIDLDAGPTPLPEGAITSNLHKGPNIDLRPLFHHGTTPFNGFRTSSPTSPPRSTPPRAPHWPTAIYSTLPEVKRFAGHTCSMWVATTTVYKDFMQWNQVSYGRNPIEVDAATCRRMRDSRQCRGKAMDITGPNSFALEGHPFVETSWLRTATEKMTNCRLEEVTLQSECPNCTLSSPLGDIPGAINGSFKHNLVTLVWDDSWKEAKLCELRVIEKVMGVKYSTKNDLITFRIRDPIKKLDFTYSMIKSSVCGGGNLIAYHPVLGIDRVVIAVREAAKGTHLVEMRPNNADAVTKMALSELTRAEIEYASHTQYIRDFAMDISNHLAREIRNLQCESRKTAYHAATTTAQYDGWLAAKHLDLPFCTKLLAVGAFVSQRYLRDGFHAMSSPTSVGQPDHQRGKLGAHEVLRLLLHANFVNFNGKAHTFKNNTWMPINPNLEIQGRRFIGTMPLEVDNSLGMILQLHPTITSHPLSASTIMADILAYIQMGYVTEMSGERHVNTVLVHPGQAQDVSFMARIGYWLRNFGIMSGVGVSIALPFGLCGLGSLLGLNIPCCRYFNPCSWLTPPQSAHRDIELGPQATTNLAPTAPVTSVNIPPPPTSAGPTGRLGLQPFLLPSTDDRENQKGGPAAWIPDPDEEDILYCAEYSSDMKEFLYVAACPDDEEDILYCADNPDDDEVMYDADVAGDIVDVSLLSVDDPWEENSFSSGTSTLFLDPVALLEDRPSPYCMLPASDVQERGIDIAALNDSIARLCGKKYNVNFVSSHYSLDSDEEDLAAARYVERIYRLPSQKEPEYGWKIGELDTSGNHSWSNKDELWPRSSTHCDI
ncbi:hypothetical protein OUZ56_011894 [Daphnia magna]|uniref:Polyprotein n=1 Tax=Daphnia magna TaxID=35525 RepID=A0ABQ9Z1G1_9CRUS|nr:hypothetical protein OUZ56_011894 [Daphnia magna]